EAPGLAARCGEEGRGRRPRAASLRGARRRRRRRVDPPGRLVWLAALASWTPSFSTRLARPGMRAVSGFADRDELLCRRDVTDAGVAMAADKPKPAHVPLDFSTFCVSLGTSALVGL